MVNQKTLKKTSKALASIMDSGRTLFWQHGVSRVTVDEICRHAEVSKMTFYRHLENKVELALIVVQQEIDQNFMSYHNIMAEEVSFHAKFEMLMEFQRESSKKISMNLVKDVYQNGSAPEVLALLHKTGLEMQEIFSCDLRQAQIDGYIRKDVKIEMVMHLISVLNQEMGSSKLLSMYDSLEDMKTDLSKFIFSGILTHEAHE